MTPCVTLITFIAPTGRATASGDFPAAISALFSLPHMVEVYRSTPSLLYWNGGAESMYCLPGLTKLLEF